LWLACTAVAGIVAHPSRKVPNYSLVDATSQHLNCRCSISRQRMSVRGAWLVVESLPVVSILQTGSHFPVILVGESSPSPSSRQRTLVAVHFENWTARRAGDARLEKTENEWPVGLGTAVNSSHCCKGNTECIFLPPGLNRTEQLSF
jgi:hypothetical protein